MSENVQSAMFEILKRIQSDLSDVKADVSALKSDVSTLKADVADVKARVERLENIAKRQRRDSAAMLVMFRGVVGLFDERVTGIEEDIRLIQGLS
jgi:septal ring factor EnvC (AmiA/AmiB activator)